MSFGSPPTPTYTAPLPTSLTAEEIDAKKKAEEEQAKMLEGRQGRASTILTGSQGLLTEPKLGKKTLLGE